MFYYHSPSAQKNVVLEEESWLFPKNVVALKKLTKLLYVCKALFFLTSNHLKMNSNLIFNQGVMV